MPKRNKLLSLVKFPRNCYRNVVKLVTGHDKSSKRRSGSKHRSKSPHRSQFYHSNQQHNIYNNNHLLRENALNHERNKKSIIKPQQIKTTTTTSTFNNYETIKSHVAISNKINDTNEFIITKQAKKEDANENFYDVLEIISNDIYLDCDSCNCSNCSNCSIIIDDNNNELETQSNNITNSSTSNEIMIYNDEPYEEEDVDLSQQKGIITHFLGQIKIGMELDKITMPAFILESRSLLEMYADFFIYTNLFLDIPNKTTPHERIKQVLRWYMSTFRACRKSTLVKKPYNPILGETFHCWYNLDPNEACSNPESKLKYVSEQVSHHPPVSAFYLEDAQKRMQLEGHNSSRIKFCGFYVYVESVGRTSLKLLDYDEEYIFQFPNAYARSVLTIPWVELSGVTSIKCAKTGYQANIEFLTKPLLGGKKNQFQGNIIGPDKKILNLLEGDWNEEMFIKTGKTKEPLIAQFTKAMRQIYPSEMQKENESKRVWCEVTKHLRNKRIDLANDAKHVIEQKQRELVKHRKEMNIEWNPVYFVLKNGHWCFKDPIINRVGAQ